jgi:hypothetical protein
MKIEGFFSGIKNANEAVERLRNAGYKNSYADINEHYIVNNNVDTNFPGNENTPSLSDLVLRSGDPSEVSDKAPLIAASPMVSGMGRFEEVMDVNYKVVTNVNDGDSTAVSKIIQDMGGTLESPNLNLPERIKDLNLRTIDTRDLNMGNANDIGHTT